MEHPVNKPRVFLSHASKDEAFIQRIYDDLRKYEIAPWKDSEEIRDGRPWLKVIFENGIPSCDAVIVYFTEHSLKSKMVERELDATVVEQLDAGGIVLLPYLSDCVLRAKLRPDIRALQCREWNEHNYEAFLPHVIGEIWRSYLERTIGTSLLQEKNRRLEAEAETKLLKEQFDSAVFSPREEKEFKFLLDRLNRPIKINVGLSADSKTVGEEDLEVNLIYLLVNSINQGSIYFDTYDVVHNLITAIAEKIHLPKYGFVSRHVGDGLGDQKSVELQTELNTYGLTTITRVQRSEHLESAHGFADKMYRLKYWLEYNGLSPAANLRSSINLRTQQEKDPTMPRNQSVVIETDRRAGLARRRKAWRINGEGTAAANEAIAWIFKELDERVRWSNENVENVRFEIASTDSDVLTLSSGDLSMELSWICATKCVSDAQFDVIISAVHLEGTADSGKLSVAKQLSSVAFDVDVAADFTLKWYRKGGGRGEPYSKEDIADYCWETLLSTIARREEGTL